MFTVLKFGIGTGIKRDIPPKLLLVIKIAFVYKIAMTFRWLVWGKFSEIRGLMNEKVIKIVPIWNFKEVKYFFL